MTTHQQAAEAHRAAAAAIRAHNGNPTDRNELKAERASNKALEASEAADADNDETYGAALEAADAWQNEDLDRAIDEHENAAAAHDRAAA